MGGAKPVKQHESAALDVFEHRLLDDRSYRFTRRHVVLRGHLRAGLALSDPEVRAALDAFPGRAVVLDGARPEVVLVDGPVTEPHPWLRHLALLLLTLFTTLMAGALLRGVDPLGTRFLELGRVALPVPTRVDWARLWTGAPFALSFLAVLLVHEAGHYLAARRHRVPVSLPWFIPFPAYWSLVGTLGAFIRIKGPMVRRSTLFDIGAAGPLASFSASVPLILWGMARSTAVPGGGAGWTPFVVEFAGQPIRIGASAAAWLASAPFFGGAPPGSAILLDPVAFAGWLGLFLTALNLLPLGQLDGGHVLYALAGARQGRAGRLFLWALLPMGFLWWGWWVWGAAAWVVNRGRMAHPPVLQDGVPLDPVRARLAWLCIAVFFLTFTPVPLEL